MRDVDFTVKPGSILALIGGSGSGKSTILRAMVGLLRPASGSVAYDGADYWSSPPADRTALARRFGVLFQGGALWSSLTLEENVILPMQMLGRGTRRDWTTKARERLEMVGLADAAARLPAEISGGMRKRAGIARALALDPSVLFLDEPSAGLDPIASRRLDDLLLSLREHLGASIVIVTHELASVFAIADTCVFLDAGTQTALPQDRPTELRDHGPTPLVRAFLRREDPNERRSAP
nr:ATP-binding cassette domain-containing protein [Belnapia arida]